MEVKGLRGEKVALRALEPSDIDFVFRLENDPAVWPISGTTAPFARALLENYLEHAKRSVHEAGQLRLGICPAGDDRLLGLIDIFEFDAHHRRAGIGLVIADPADRGRGFGLEAVELLSAHAFGTLGLHQLYANITSDNAASIALFERAGFAMVGVKKDWTRTPDGFVDELLYQKIDRS